MSSGHILRPCGAKIFYQMKGSGTPVLLLAPGGMRSMHAMWNIMPYNPWTELPTSNFQLISIDQRSSQIDGEGGNSSAQFSLDDGWHTFMHDHIAILDHLGIEKCLSVGMCIGPSYQLQLMRESPQRFGAAVFLQPIGLTHHTSEPKDTWKGLNTTAAKNWYRPWARAMRKNGKITQEQSDALYENMFGPDKDFVFSISREDLRQIQSNLLVFAGLDMSHPAQIAREIVDIAPNATLVEEWRDCGEEKLEAAKIRIETFLMENRF